MKTVLVAALGLTESVLVVLATHYWNVDSAPAVPLAMIGFLIFVLGCGIILHKEMK